MDVKTDTNEHHMKSLAQHEYLFTALKREIEKYEKKNKELYHTFKKSSHQSNIDVCSLMDLEFQEIIQKKKDALEKHRQLLDYLTEQKAMMNSRDKDMNDTVRIEQQKIKKNINLLKEEINTMIQDYNDC